MNRSDEDLAQTRRRCALATRLWDRMFSALTCIAYRAHGEEGMRSLWFAMLSNHQGGHYRDGLKLLGIDKDPPAIAAAKYHYLSNQIGERRMAYIEESPKKVWIRYMAPVWMYDGVSLLALPRSSRRMVLTVWHPRNGPMMGCARLGYVATKFITEGEPYDEGYFIEHDRDLAPAETLKFETARHTPEFDPAKAPKLDPAAWPEARVLKARRNFAGGYVTTAIEVLTSAYGEGATAALVAEAMDGLAVQYVHELRDMAGIAGTGAGAIAALFAALLEACYQEFSVESASAAHHRIVLKTFRPFSGTVSEALRAAFFRFPFMATRVLDGRISASRQAGADGTEIWDFKDAGRWLW
ncbi:MAG: hypothetical protein ACKVSF_15495 [Alphaproteobacteria bacterium]